MKDTVEEFCKQLYHIGCIKFGKFTLKSGKESEYYVDLRCVISHPAQLEELSSLMCSFVEEKRAQFDTICGVPYTALPFSTLLSLKTHKPMVLRRKEVKTYGTKQLIDGKYNQGDICIIVEDVITTGASVLETIRDLESVGLVVKDVFAIVDREEGGVQTLIDRGYRTHCLFSLSQVLQILNKGALIDTQVVQRILTHLKSLSQPQVAPDKPNRTSLSFEKRVGYAKSAAAANLFSLMAQKKTNLCLAADVTDMDQLLKLAKTVGPHICILKVHLDIVDLYSEAQIEELKTIANRHNFLIMEDRKLADIGNTVKMQFNQISKYAKLVTVHSLPGFGVLDAIQKAENYKSDYGVFLIAELSCQNNFINEDYTKKTVALAEKYAELVAGFVCQLGETFSDPGLVQFTPGVNMEQKLKGDDLGQQYNTPETVVVDRSADVAVVGRGIINADDPAKVAEKYKNILWNAYMSRLR